MKDGQLGGMREFFIKIGNEEGCKLILFAFCIILMVAALFLSSSRGGVISFSASMVYLLFMVTKRERGRQNVLIVVGLLVSIFSFLIWMGIKPMVEEFSTIGEISRDYDIQYRFQNWKDSSRMVRYFPLFGVGAGSFSSLFPQFKTSVLQHYYLYLENDYLQLLCEMGLLGFGIFVWFIFSFFREIGSAYSKYGLQGMRSMHYTSFYGCLAGVVAMMIHSLWDFNMHIPSNALLLTSIMGLAIAGGRIGPTGRFRYSEARNQGT
jgi:O-antigen ligase